MPVRLGDRVELTYGVLKGEKATIVPDENGEWHYNDEDGGEMFYIRFDRHNVECGHEQGFAVLNNRWEAVEELKII